MEECAALDLIFLETEFKAIIDIEYPEYTEESPVVNQEMQRQRPFSLLLGPREPGLRRDAAGILAAGGWRKVMPSARLATVSAASS